MPLAILLDAIGKSAQAPIFLLFDFAALAFDDGLEVGRKCIDLLRADILARDQEMLVKSHVRSFSSPAEQFRVGHPSLLRLTRPAHNAHPLFSGRPATAAV